MPARSSPSAGGPRWSVGGQLLTILVILALAVGVVVVREPARSVGPDTAVDRYRDPGGRPGDDPAGGPAATPAPSPATSAPGPTASSPTPGTTPEARPSASAAPSPAATGPSPDATPAEPGAPASDPSPDDERRRPRAGVYTYATEGHDRIDAGGGRQHDYPERTTITLHHTECGADTRWDVLEERWDEASLCDEDGTVVIRGLVSYREFLGYGQRREFTCEVPVLPPDPQPGQRWDGRCSGDDTQATVALTVVGRETVTVAGSPVEAVHIRSETTFSGATRGSQTADRWLHPRTGLELRGTSATEVTTTSPFGGDVRYEERFDRRLTSLEPRG